MRHYHSGPPKTKQITRLYDYRPVALNLWHSQSAQPKGALLFSLYTNDCTSKEPTVKLLKFADNTTVIGLIQNGDESANSWLSGAVIIILS